MYSKATNNKLKKLSVGRDFIVNNYQEPLSLSEIAQCSYMSPYHFLRVFKDTYGETPNEFLIRLRVEQAKKMLITENYSVSEICERVGYTSLGSFSSLFLKQVGMAPTLYRRKLGLYLLRRTVFPRRLYPHVMHTIF